MLENVNKIKKPVTLRLCGPRGFCAGVDRAIQIVVMALKKYGKPVYVRHEIVHNRYVVESLQQLGAVFIEDLEEISLKHQDRPVIFSAHGVPESVLGDAKNRNLFYLDATCPLVSKVHKQALRHYRLGRHVLLIGHAGHPEVIGTMGQLPEGTVTLIQNESDIEKVKADYLQALGYVSQTTLSLEDTEFLVKMLYKHFPELHAPTSESLCYATTNRQEAVKQAAQDVDVFFIVGSSNSSNSQRLVEVAHRSGAKKAILVQGVQDIPWNSLEDLSLFALSAGASAPEILINEIISSFQKHFEVQLDLFITKIETEKFPVLRGLNDVNLTSSDLVFVNGVL